MALRKTGHGMGYQVRWTCVLKKQIITYRNYQEVVGPRPSLPVYHELVALGRIAPREVETSNGKRNVKA